MRMFKSWLAAGLGVALLSGPSLQTAAYAASSVSPAPVLLAATIPAAPVMEQSQADFLARSSLMSIHDAMMADNYTVLRDLGSPSFHVHSAGDLARNLQQLKARKLDLASAAMMTLRLTNLAASPDGRRVSFRGTFDTAPEAVEIDFTFERVGQHWRHAALNVSLVARQQTATR